MVIFFTGFVPVPKRELLKINRDYTCDGFRNLSRTEEGYHHLWSIFQERALSILEKVSGKQRPVILWTSTLTEKNTVDKYLSNKKYIIQIWTKGDDAVIGELLKKGFRVIFSNYDALYFDCGFVL
jgi:hexosaminidase